MKTIFRFLWVAICLIPNLLVSANQPQFAAPPSWVQPIQPNWELPTPDEEITGGLFYLLDDNQHHLVLGEQYRHSAYRIVSSTGMENGSEFSVTWDPAYQTVVIHKIQIIRDGVKENRLDRNSFNILQQELNAQMHIYNGQLTAYTILSDIRPGDVVEYDYTIKGKNPAFGSQHFTHVTLGSTAPIGQLHCRVIGASNTQNDAAEIGFIPKEKGNEKNWDRLDVPATQIDDELPDWYIPLPIVSFTSYRDWGHVAKEIYALFQQVDKPGKAITDRVNQIRNDFSSQDDQIAEAVRFVQDEIRYMGVETGVSGFRPYPPEKILAQRYGDCKDKSLLLVNLLRGLGVKAHPMLVSTTLREHVQEWLPIPTLFDHCIVRVETPDGGFFLVDPTDRHFPQSPAERFIPPYGKGLVLDPNTTGLITLQEQGTNYVLIKESFSLGSPGSPSEIMVSSDYMGGVAASMRQTFENNSKSDIEKFLLQGYTNIYPDIEAIESPTWVDEGADNRFSLVEQYKIPNAWKSESDKPGVEILATNIIQAIGFSYSRQRKSPLRLPFPSHINYTWNLAFYEPYRLDVRPYSVKTKYLTFDFSPKTMGQNIRKHHIVIEFETHQDHVPVEDLEAFGQIWDQIDQNLGLILDLKNDNNLTNPINWGPVGIVIFLVLVGILAFVLIRYLN